MGMLNYTEEYCRVRNALFSPASSDHHHPEAFKDILLLEDQFHSDFSVQVSKENSGYPYPIFGDSRDTIDINNHFSYPVIRPRTPDACRKAIILLHGLNERSWDKYLPWAYSLAQQTGKSVILFPIAYHMNRSPESWKNPRTMSPFVDLRLKNMPGLLDSSYLNVALSERLTNNPQRFFLAGYQAAHDIIKLLDDLKEGRNQLFEKNTEVDFFSYSIGVLLSQVLLLTNPGKRFDQTKFFFFCGGSVMEGMHGESKYILDNEAFARLSGFYTQAIESETKKTGLFADLLSQTQLGQTFLNLTSYARLNRFGQKLFKKFRNQIQTVCLTNDHVMPPSQVKKTLKDTSVTEMDFPYPYTHELPFPLRVNRVDRLIDKAFEQVFRKAGLFLA
jgi:hypothetical protein